MVIEDLLCKYNDNIRRKKDLTLMTLYSSAKVAENQELSVLKVYFPTSDSILYKIDVLFAWYDVVSDYGGLTGLCLGCSIISIFEFLYFVTLRFYQNLFNSMSFMNKFNQKHKSNIFGPVRNLYRPKFEYLN